jgi:hypothetical protein
LLLKIIYYCCLPQAGLTDQFPALDRLKNAGKLNQQRHRQPAGQLTQHGVLIPLQGMIARVILE